MISYKFININIQKTSLYYLVLVLVAIIFPLTYYPRIYGKDGFQVIWMANALREGALFSDNTWLIHPTSYFGYYPFSHRAIGVPIFLAFLISLLNFFSLGIFGITEAILAFNIILIIIIYKSSRNLGKRLFEEEWSRFIFVAAILLSPNVIYDTTMTVSTRIIITIVMIVLLNINLKVLNNDNKNINKFKTTLFIILLLLVGALAHRLWLVTTITIIFMIFTVFIRKYKKLQHITIFLILPLSIIAFFVGLEIFGLDPSKIWSPFFDNSTLIGVSTNLSIDYALKAGLILLFFPVGVIITLYKLTILLKKSDDEKKVQFNNKNQQFIRMNFYLLLFIVTFSFMAPSFYAVVIFLPIIIFFSVQGLIYIKKLISTFSKKLDWVFPLILLFPSVGYSLLYVEIILQINLWYMFALLIISLLFYLFVIIISKYHNILLIKDSLISFKLQKWFVGFVLIISMLIFTTTTVVGRNTAVDSNPYPWENSYLTEEEIEIIEFFQNEDVEGLIFCAAGPLIAERIAGFGFLPSFFDRVYDGKNIYYGFVTQEEVYENTEFSLLELDRFRFFIYNKNNSIRALMNSIINLSVSVKGDLETLRSYNVQYIISINEIFLLGGINNWPLIQSLPSTLSPVFSTEHLLVWKIY